MVVPSHLTTAVAILRPQSPAVRIPILRLIGVDVELVAVQNDQLFAPISGHIGDIEPVGLFREPVEEPPAKRIEELNVPGGMALFGGGKLVEQLASSNSVSRLCNVVECSGAGQGDHGSGRAPKR